MKYSAFTLCATVLLMLAFPARAANIPSEISIKPDGTFFATNVIVMQKSEKAGTNLFSRVTWGSVFLRITVLASSAKIIKNNGGSATVEDIRVGDILSVKGTLAPGADSLVINALEVRDLSLNVESKNISGIIKMLNVPLNSFTLTDKKLGAVSVVAPYKIQKGARTISVGELAVGDKALSATGSFDYLTKTFTASDMEVYQDKSVFKAQNFQGTLKSLPGTALPTIAVITVGKTDYTIYLAASAKVMSKNKAATSLQRFTVGDKVRFYGAIRQTNLFEIDAEIVRNLNF